MPIRPGSASRPFGKKNACPPRSFGERPEDFCEKNVSTFPGPSAWSTPWSVFTKPVHGHKTRPLHKKCWRLLWEYVNPISRPQNSGPKNYRNFSTDRRVEIEVNTGPFQLDTLKEGFCGVETRFASGLGDFSVRATPVFLCLHRCPPPARSAVGTFVALIIFIVAAVLVKTPWWFAIIYPPMVVLAEYAGGIFRIDDNGFVLLSKAALLSGLMVRRVFGSW